MNTQIQPTASLVRAIDARCHPRFKVEGDIRIHSRTCGSLSGRTVDLSESGISIMLSVDLPLGEVVELAFMLPLGPATINAVVRQQNAFRYGFQFLELNAGNEAIRSTCRQLAVEQSLKSPDTQ